jgi:hypothetical protein
MSLDEFQDKGIRRQVALASHFLAHLFILLVIEVVVVSADIKHSIASYSPWLMHLEIKAYTYHNPPTLL